MEPGGGAAAPSSVGGDSASVADSEGMSGSATLDEQQPEDDGGVYEGEYGEEAYMPADEFNPVNSVMGDGLRKASRS